MLDTKIADFTINIAHSEGFGLSTLESMMTGTPIIAPMTGGQTTLELDLPTVNHASSEVIELQIVNNNLKVAGLSDDDRLAHNETLERIASKSGNCIWKI